MAENLVKVFTRDFALFTCEWWRSELIEKFKRHVGLGYKDAPITSNGRAVTAYYLQSDIEGVKNACIAKFKAEPNYYFKNREKFLADTAESKRLVSELTNADFTREVAAKLRSRFMTIFPMTRYTVFVPHFWAEDVRKHLGKAAEPLIAATLQDREKTEGVAEKIDSVLRFIIGKKLKQLGKPTVFAKFLTSSEFDLLAAGKEDKIDWGNIATRTAGYVYCCGELYATPAYQTIFKKHGYIYNEEKIPASELKGTVAVPADGGVVRGKAQVIFALEEVAKFKQGNVLVTSMTVPDFIPAMKRAAAIVTDEGGVTCHAAIVSRELGIPCIIGTRVATKLFKDGDEVEVDTQTGVVKKL